LQEVDQVLHRLLREANLETVVIEIHHLLEVGCNSVVEIRGTRCQASQDETLASAYVSALSVYVGDAANLGSTSPVLNQVVLETTSTATLTSSPNPSKQGQAVTFTAKISSPTVIPTGPVTFTAGKTPLGTAQLSVGKATLTTSSLTHGSTKVTATYYGDSNITKSSASVIQTVQ
jgi:hypothetical protein